MKDPAILFYTADFLTGTFTMSDDQVGKYIRLLCLQHQKGFLCEKDMLNICKSYDEDIYSKFIKDGGKYFNERMKFEAEKRKKYSESRSENRKNKSEKPLKSKKKILKKDMLNISKTYDKHMENENENINENIIYKKCIEIYFDLYEQKTGLKPAFSGAEGKHLKELITKIENSIKQKDGQVTDEKIESGFKAILTKLPKFYSDKIDIKIINSKYDGIIAEIKTKPNSQDTMQNIIADRDRKRKEAIANG